MAAVGLLALLDDIATLLDDVAMLSKVAVKKTAGVLGDDLALNAEQVSGVRAQREIPVVWAVAKGSIKNKFIIVPVALALSALAPWVITPLLIIGGLFLCFEGVEKVFHHLFASDHEQQQERKLLHQALLDQDVNMVEFERQKIKGAIRTDFILSAEIVVIALGTVRQVDFMQQVLVVSLIALGITVAVYGTVAAIVKLDDLGLYLQRNRYTGNTGRLLGWFGGELISFCPYLMRGLAIVGTAAMFLVGGGILVHGIPMLHDVLHHVGVWIQSSAIAFTPEFIYSGIYSALCGLVAGSVLLVLISLGQRLKAQVFKKAA